MAPVMIEPAMMPPMTAPGPQPQRRCALASVAVAASEPVMMAAAVSAVSVFFMPISLKMVGSADQEFNRPEGNMPEGQFGSVPIHLTYTRSRSICRNLGDSQGEPALNRPGMKLTKPE